MCIVAISKLDILKARSSEFCHFLPIICYGWLRIINIRNAEVKINRSSSISIPPQSNYLFIHFQNCMVHSLFWMFMFFTFLDAQRGLLIGLSCRLACQPTNLQLWAAMWSFTAGFSVMPSLTSNGWSMWRWMAADMDPMRPHMSRF